MDLMEAARDVVAASIAGAAGIVAGQPFDTVKVRLQTQPSAQPGAALRYSGPVHCAWRILKEEGVRGFFKGMVSPIIANAPINAILFAVEGATMKRLARDGWDPEAASSHAVAGAVSGLSQTPLASASELVKIRLQCQLDSGGNHGPIETARGILRSEGLAGMFRGYTATLARDVPAFGIYFGSYHVMKQALADAHPVFQADDDDDDDDDDNPSSADRAEPGALAQLLAGGMAGTASWLVLHPVDVIKSVVQQQTPATPAEQVGPLNAARYHLRVDGPKFFLRGIVPTCLRAFPASAVIFLAYETIRPALPF